MTERALNWINLSEDNLSTKVLKKYQELKSAQRHAGELRKEFEEAMVASARNQKAIGDDEVFVFSYRFGKLSVAKKAAEKPAPRATTVAFKF